MARRNLFHSSSEEMNLPVSPHPLEVLANLLRLDLGSNQLVQFPMDVTRLTNLEVLDMSRNRLGGPIPSALGVMRRLHELDLSGNSFTGSIVTDLTNLINLTIVLDLSENELSGTIPFQLSNLIKLKQLYLNANKLTGSIPSELGPLEPNHNHPY